MTSVRSLSDVPEEGVLTAPSSPLLENSPYLNSNTNGSASSTNTLYSGPAASGSGSNSRGSRKASTPSVRTLGRPSSGEALPSSSGGKRHSSSSSTSTSASRKPPTPHLPIQKTRSTPRLPHDKDVESAPSTAMYWSRAPVYGALPTRTMRAHSVNLIDTTAWVFGGCEDNYSPKDMKDIYCFDIETMQWSQRDTKGDIPPACRAHTTTLVDRKLIVFGGGQGAIYYDTVYILDISTRTWTRPKIKAPYPPCRRAHSAVLYQQKIWVFGGGNGMTALHDVWTLDISDMAHMKWEQQHPTGRKPDPRGYHTANLVGNVMIVVGGSNAKEFFHDIWCLNLDTLVWNQIHVKTHYQRMTHTTTQVGSYLFIFGGHDGKDYCHDLLLFNLVSLEYEQRQIFGKTPSPRGYHSTILADSRLFTFGGYNGNQSYDDVHLLDLAAGAYLPQVTSFNLELD
ncbi:hypothetical protein BDZ94DRAFT_1218326 [Collybia nuda]|uniref:Tip elongation aberrant protein 1 n=1 Tax=Collybia nuda TaxID=64659 RepID=A0A9P5Y734_9AGAR|nr:hypothetical protein BDZ94DRAFT_1218326 [Collybia nuda]